MKKTRIVSLLIVMTCLIAVTGIAMAAQMPPATPETQLAKTGVTISVASGTVSTSKSMVMQVTDNDAGTQQPARSMGGRAQVINSYSEMGDFKNGATEYCIDFHRRHR